MRLIEHLCSVALWVAAVLLTANSIPHPALAQPPASALAELDKIEVLDLATAARIALASNPSLEAAQARVMQASQIVKQAQAPYWPQVDASAGAARVDMAENDFRSQQAIAQLFGSDLANPEDHYNASVTASWLVFDGFARKFRLAGARYGEQATAAAQEDARRLLLSAVAFAYLQAQLSKENVAISIADEEFNQRLLTEARLRYDVGTGALSDVLNFQIRGNSAHSRRIQEETNYNKGLISLAALLGVPQGKLPAKVRIADLTPTSDQELAVPQSDEQVATAMRLRPDLQRGDWTMRQAEASVKVARAGYFPTISVFGTVDGARTEDMAFESDDFGNSVGVGLNWNIFAGGLTRARHGEAKARLYETEMVLADAKVQVASEIENIAEQINNAQAQLQLQETNTQLVQQQRDLVEKEYKAGVGSLVRLNEAQRDLIVAQAQLALARVALRFSWYDLQTSTGQILETFK